MAAAMEVGGARVAPDGDLPSKCRLETGTVKAEPEATPTRPETLVESDQSEPNKPLLRVL